MPDSLYATVSEVKQYLRVTVNDDDALLARMVLSASAWIDQYCSRKFLVDNYTERRDTTGGDSLMLANRPVIAVASVQVGQPNTVPRTLTPNVDYYATDAAIVFLCGVPRGRGTVLVTYSAGYDLVPWEVKQACIEITAFRYKEKSRIAQKSVTVGGNETVSFITDAVPKNIGKVLDQLTNIVPV